MADIWINNPWLVEVIGGIVSGIVVGIILKWLSSHNTSKTDKQPLVVLVIKTLGYLVVLLLAAISFLISLPFSILAVALAGMTFGFLSFGRSACIYTPECKDYLIEAIRVHGLLKGSLMGYARIMRCGPWGKGGYDPVPPRKDS